MRAVWALELEKHLVCRSILARRIVLHHPQAAARWGCVCDLRRDAAATFCLICAESLAGVDCCGCPGRSETRYAVPKVNLLDVGRAQGARILARARKLPAARQTVGFCSCTSHWPVDARVVKDVLPHGNMWHGINVGLEENVDLIGPEVECEIRDKVHTNFITSIAPVAVTADACLEGGLPSIVDADSVVLAPIGLVTARVLETCDDRASLRTRQRC